MKGRIVKKVTEKVVATKEEVSYVYDEIVKLIKNEFLTKGLCYFPKIGWLTSRRSKAKRKYHFKFDKIIFHSDKIRIECQINQQLLRDLNR